MSGPSALKALEPLKIRSIADTVFEELHQQILSLELPPGTRMSELDVAKALGVSRQPVRDAFFRLSQLGFILIRPQRATEISKVSEAAVLRARFIRTALEIACLRAAMDVITADQLNELEAMLEEQQAAVSADLRQKFHQLDDAFHLRICQIADHDYAWTLIREQKAHMDRVRFLSLASGAQIALDDHRKIVQALRESDSLKAEQLLTSHLGRIALILGQIRAEHADYFEE
ncbi:GntR family transcriptional regulator [Roseibium sp. CAU 1637]|uniref:GntR family transcriptional regulator n=1 Tax=Roseibium limicola TaxID=2816037 RepID=A0A939ELS8_9HYPH|nr:GntR family transcriptional regulator [Roseibium limicola]MBO0344162.1 GntR family transcriptional regulator [Roseibium limicola]